MQGRLTKLRILFHCLLDGGQFTMSRRYTKTPLRFLPEAAFCVRLTAH